MDAILTARSAVSSLKIKDENLWAAIDNYYIEQSALLLKHGHEHNRQASGKFYDFLFSEAARNILDKYGYVSDRP